MGGVSHSNSFSGMGEQQIEGLQKVIKRAVEAERFERSKCDAHVRAYERWLDQPWTWKNYLAWILQRVGKL